jgi:hypothetical protein
MARRRGGTQAQKANVQARRRAGVVLDFNFRGVKGVREKLIKFRLTTGRQVLRKAIKKAADQVLKPAIDAGIATVSPGIYGSGRMKQMGTKVVRTNKKPSSVQHRVQTASRTDLNIQGDKKAYYPAIIEVGGKASGSFPPKIIAPHRFMRRARDQSARRVKSNMRRSIPKLMDDAIRKLAKKGKTPFRPERQIQKFHGRRNQEARQEGQNTVPA